MSWGPFLSGSDSTASGDDREGLTQTLSAVTFLIFFQAYMMAPLIPALSAAFAVPVEWAGVVVPAYLIPYGVATLFYGLLADRLGVRPVLTASLVAFAALTALTATAASLSALTIFRVLTGLGASGVVPLALVTVGAIYPFEQRGRPLGWLFGAMAGGMAFGSTFGAMVEPFVGWRGLFLIVAAAVAPLAVILMRDRRLPATTPRMTSTNPAALIGQYRDLLASPRSRRTYGYVLINSVFHSGVFTWLGVYFHDRYGLGPFGIGLALLGYGVPGFLFGPVIGRAADRYGRARLVPIGLGVGAIGAALLVPRTPLAVAALATTVLSLGYDLTQPLLAGIVTALSPSRPGQAMGFNVFTLFVGFGLGSLVFGALLPRGLPFALGLFAGAQAAGAVWSLGLFRTEMTRRVPAPGTNSVNPER